MPYHGVALHHKRTLFLAALTVALALGGLHWSAAQTPTATLRLLTREATRQLPTVVQNNQEYIALEDLATAFGITFREDGLAGAMTITARGQTIILTADQSVVSVGGRLVSLTAAPTRQGTRWLIPLDFLPRALGIALETRIELRRNARLVIVGDLRVPRVVVRVEAGPASASVTFDATPPTAARVTGEPGRLIVTFDADAVDLSVPSLPPQDFLQAVQPGDTQTTVRVITGPKFGMHRVTTSQPDASSSRVVIDLLPPGTEPLAPTQPAPTPVEPLPLPLPVPATGVRTVVIDPGHGGEELGAQGARGTLEKDITLAVARRVRTLIESRLGLRVYLTRDDDRTMSLDDRSAFANSQQADVFVSIHANAAVRPAMKGAEVYYLSVDRADAEARQACRILRRAVTSARRRHTDDRPDSLGDSPGPLSRTVRRAGQLRRAGAPCAGRRWRRARYSRRPSACWLVRTCRRCSSRSATCRIPNRNSILASGRLSGTASRKRSRCDREVPRSRGAPGRPRSPQ